MKDKKLELIYLNKEQLQHLEENPRKILDPKGIEKLKALIKTHGFQNPLQVYFEKDNKYTVLCGNHRLKAAVELGINEFPCIVYKGDKKKAIARAVSDNKSNEWTDWDLPLLKDMLESFDDGQTDIEAITGITMDEVEDLMNQYYVETGDGEKEVDENIETKNQCPSCGYEW